MPLSREELLVAVEENPEALFELYASQIPEASFVRDASMRRMFFGVPVSFFNGIAMARLTIDNCEPIIDAAVAEMNANAMPWSWQVGPLSTPSELHKHLLNHGMRHSHDMPIMAVMLNNWQPGDPLKNYETIPVEDPSTFDQWCDVAQLSFELPDTAFNIIRRAQSAIGFGPDSPVRNFLGLADGEPVCSGTVFYNHRVAGIFTIGTPPVHRGNGYGTAVTEACMREARNRGFDVAFLQASKMGYTVYQKIGFQEVCKLSVYTPKEAPLAATHERDALPNA